MGPKPALDLQSRGPTTATSLLPFAEEARQLQLVTGALVGVQLCATMGWTVTRRLADVSAVSSQCSRVMTNGWFQGSSHSIIFSIQRVTDVCAATMGPQRPKKFPFRWCRSDTGRFGNRPRPTCHAQGLISR